MLFQKNMIVVLTNGRLAGKKGVVLEVLNDKYLLVGGVNRVPIETSSVMPDWQIQKNKKFLTFIKKINMSHVIATRYKAFIDMASLNYEKVLSYLNESEEQKAEKKHCEEEDALFAEKKLNEKIVLNEKFNTIMKRHYEEGIAKWLFTELKF